MFFGKKWKSKKKYKKYKWNKKEKFKEIKIGDEDEDKRDRLVVKEDEYEDEFFDGGNFEEEIVIDDEKDEYGID